MSFLGALLFLFSPITFAKAFPTGLIPPSTTFAPKRVVIETKINLNSAKIKDLVGKIKGIGPKKAQAIIQYRRKNGPFTNLNDLALVKGLGKNFVTRHQKDLEDIFYCH